MNFTKFIITINPDELIQSFVIVINSTFENKNKKQKQKQKKERK